MGPLTPLVEQSLCFDNDVKGHHSLQSSFRMQQLLHHPRKVALAVQSSESTVEESWVGFRSQSSKMPTEEGW